MYMLAHDNMRRYIYRQGNSISKDLIDKKKKTWGVNYTVGPQGEGGLRIWFSEGYAPLVPNVAFFTLSQSKTLTGVRFSC